MDGNFIKQQKSDKATKKSFFLKIACFFLLGQTVSILITAMNVCNNQLTSLNSPAFQNLFIQVALFIVHGSISIFIYISNKKNKKIFDSITSDRIKKRSWLKLGDFLEAPLYLFALVSAFDVGGNFLLVYAYQYTTITSATALDCWTIPCVAILSIFLLKVKYNLKQVIAIVLSLFGLGAIIGSDALAKNNDPDAVPQNAILGDVYVLLGATCYAFSNVLAQQLVKQKHFSEYLMMNGFFGSIYLSIITLTTEMDHIKAFEWDYDMKWYFAGFILSGFLFYSGTGLFLTVFDALGFNLSVLTSDIYAILFSYFVFHYGGLTWLYFVGFTLVSVGVIVYSYEFTKAEAKNNKSYEVNVEPDCKECE